MTLNRPQLDEGPTLSDPRAPVLPRHALHDQEILWSDFLAMAHTVVIALEKSLDALCEGKLELVSEVKHTEELLDREEVRIEQECLRILALYEPVASDLRRTTTMLKVTRDWERIADLAARLARRARKIARVVLTTRVPQALKDLAYDVQARTAQCHQALKDRDPSLARSIIAADRAIDLQYRNLRRALKDHIRQNPSQLDASLQYMSAARNLERIADHSTGIAQMIVYLQEGIFLRHSSKRHPASHEAPPR